LKANNQTSFIPLNTVPSGLILISDSRADNIIEYILSNRLTSAPESRNDFRISRMMSVLKSRINNLNEFDSLNRILRQISMANSSLNYINRTSRPIRPIPLKSKDNTMNVLCNISICHFDTINEVVPSPFNKMTIYQLCLWLCMNLNVLQLANNMHLLMQTPVVDRS